MAKEICISSTPHETRLAILEDDQLAEIYYERENEYTLAGSIYNGRVTRVLPGMQSAFVDIGLERDAFLYVTDFMELEDPEETDEIEKAATTGIQAPREVRRNAAPENAGGRGGQKPEQKQEQKQRPEQRQDRPVKESRLLVESAPDADEPVAQAVPYASEQAAIDSEESGEPGAKRWRGRRRRRGGRGGSNAPETQAETQASPGNEIEEDVVNEPEVAEEIFATEAVSTPRAERAPRAERTPRAERVSAPDEAASSAPTPFVMPGESLRKYGGTAAEEAPKAEAPARPASSFKPATLIEVPLGWDGSGLLPGESLSKHRGREPEPVVAPEPIVESAPEVAAEELPQTGYTGYTEAVAIAAPDAVEEEEFIEETTEPAPVVAVVPAPTEAPCEPVVLAPVEPIAEAVAAVHATVQKFVAPAVAPTLTPVLATKTTFESWESITPEGDATASHKVDPLPPSGFRLFGLGGKKKKEGEEEDKHDGAPVSTYAPGSGPLEEEMIEEEEFDAPRAHHHKTDEHDLEDFEEETLPKQLRAADLGELLQEAHLDHRIQLNFDGKDEESFDEDEESSEGQPAVAEGQGQQRRDRSAKGRRGRGQQAASQPGQHSAPQNRRGGPTRRSMQTSDLPIISDLLKPGQEILVQIAKEPIAMKGARITSHIALPGRFLVFMPTVTHIGVSRKIESDAERQRLKRILVSERGEASGGFIVRTAAEGASEEELRADLRFLLHLWADIKQRSETSKSPALIYHDLSLIERILRDQVSTNFTNIWVDTEANYERIVRFLNHFSPALTRRVKLYTKETPLFEHFGVQDEISKALRSKVWLKSGGSIVINQTEALVAIDINTGKYVGKSARLEDTIVKTNLDAVPEIVRQIRLRDLGGIIVIDFIDMDDRKNRYKVMAALEEALKSDRAPTKVLQFNDFGLVAITRKRVKQSLERTLSVPCPTCQATGMVKSPTTVCNEIYIELRKMKKHFEGADVLLRVNPETVKVLKANNASWITEFEELVGKNILIKSDATLHPEQFDIQG